MTLRTMSFWSRESSVIGMPGRPSFLPVSLTVSVPCSSRASPQQRELALFAVEHLEDFVGALRLVPVGVARVIGLFVETLRRVAVEDRAAEGRAFDGVAVAAARAVPAGEHELELAGAGLAEERDGGLPPKPCLAAVVLDLFVDRLGVFLAVHAHENLLHHLLLVGGEELGECSCR